MDGRADGRTNTNTEPTQRRTASELFGSLLFSLSLNFKQMALYYAPAIFFFLLACCLRGGRGQGGEGRGGSGSGARDASGESGLKQC